MQESEFCFHNVEWPASGAHIIGPVAWLRGWIVGKSGHDFIDVRVKHNGHICLGIIGLPRVDLAAHFKPENQWLPAEFILGVPVTEGAVTFALEAMDANGTWHHLHDLPLTIAADGEPCPRVEGRLEEINGNICTMRDAHHPFHGHLDQPEERAPLRHGRLAVFGWLLDETGPLSRAAATTDGLVFNHLAHSLQDDSLASKVSHPGARHARLRGAVDFPATLNSPPCLRVYAIRPDQSVHLCFAKRISPSVSEKKIISTSAVALSPITNCSLPALPSGRPRRLLIVLRSLQPDDSALRALDLARKFYAEKSWAVRIVSTEDGPLRQAFEQVDAESLIVSPELLLTAPDEAAARHAFDQLKRQIWWKHLDAVAVFNSVCGWAASMARTQGIPVLFDCLEVETMSTDPTASSAVRTLLQASWREADAICYGSRVAAKAQESVLHEIPAEIIPLWHTPDVSPAAATTGESRRAIAPLRMVDWLRRSHADVFARWQFFQGPAPINFIERLHELDDRHNAGLVQHRMDWNVDDIAIVLGPLFDRGPLRPLLDAAAKGIPFAAPDTPITREYFHDCRLPMIDEANPLAPLHFFLQYDRDPSLFAKEAEFAREYIRERHAPEHWLPRWSALLDSAAAARG